MSRIGTLEQIWVFYLSTVLGIVAAFGFGRPGVGEPGVYVAIHLALLVAVIWMPRLARRPEGLAVARGAFAVVALPTVFYSLALVLPAIHPEPYEYTWIAVDRAVFGADPTVALQALLWPPFVEALQLAYASFYAIPILAVVTVARRGGRAAFESAIELVVLGFVLSYLGYLLWPTLPPYRFLEHDVPIEGVWAAGQIHAALDVAEVHRWNCFPSGHTMLSVLSLCILWRGARPVFWAALPVVALLVFSTVALRYHYVVDVAAGLLGVWGTLWLGRRLRGG